MEKQRLQIQIEEVRVEVNKLLNQEIRKECLYALELCQRDINDQFHYVAIKGILDAIITRIELNGLP